jgi:hypothetical protein
MLVKLTRPLVVALAFFAASQAQAATPTAADRATARRLMTEGRILRHDENLEGALEKFKAAEALVAVPTTGLEVARTQAELGLLVEALDSCARVLRHPEKDGEPKPFGEARAKARELRAELQPRTPMLRFVFPANADTSLVQLRVDGITIPKEAYSTPRLVNPGLHEVVLTDGPHQHKVVVVVAEKESRDVVLVLAKPRTKQPPPVEQGPGPWVWAGFTTAAVGGAVGTVAGMLAWSERRKLDDECPNHVCTDGNERLDRSYGYANVSTYAFLVGGVGAAVGIGALLSSPDRKEPSDVSVRVVPHGEGGALWLDGQF